MDRRLSKKVVWLKVPPRVVGSWQLWDPSQHLRWTKEAQAAAGSGGGPSTLQPPVLLGSQAPAMLQVNYVLRERLPPCAWSQGRLDPSLPLIPHA